MTVAGPPHDAGHQRQLVVREAAELGAQKNVGDVLMTVHDVEAAADVEQALLEARDAARALGDGVLECRALNNLLTIVPPHSELGAWARAELTEATQMHGIDRLGASIHERYRKLDVLVANAGILGGLTPMSHVEPKVFDDVMAINVTANYRLIRSLDPLLRQSDAGRAIFVTSGISRKVVPYWGAYAASKAALDMLVGIYAAECEHTKVRVNLYNPGPVRTGMRKEAFPGEDPRSVPPPEAHAEGLIQLALPSCTMNGEWITGDQPRSTNPH